MDGKAMAWLLTLEEGKVVEWIWIEKCEDCDRFELGCYQIWIVELTFQIENFQLEYFNSKLFKTLKETKTC